MTVGSKYQQFYNIMRQIRKIVLKIAAAGCCLMFVSAMLCSCSSDDDTATPEDGNQRSMRQLTITRASSGMRKAKIDPTSLEAAWQTTDRPTYVNLSALPSNNLYHGALTPTGAGISTTLTGNVYCSNGDDIAVIFPKATPVKPAGEGGYFTIDLSGQKGTLDDIGAHYHYAYGVASGISVRDNIASGTIDEMKSLLSLCRFTFTHGGSPVNVKSVQISWGDTGTAGYPNTGTASLAATLDVHAKSGTPVGQPLTIMLDEPTGDGVVYVALFPCDDRLTFHFTVSDGTNTYTATKTAKMLEGKYYEVEVALE